LEGNPHRNIFNMQEKLERRINVKEEPELEGILSKPKVIGSAKML
jgi:hypothetical protein